MNTKSLDKRVKALEAARNDLFLEGTMPDGCVKLFDKKKLINLQFEAQFAMVNTGKAAEITSFCEEDQKYIKDFIKARFSPLPFLPWMRRNFVEILYGDLEIKDNPLGAFMDPWIHQND